MPTENHAKVRVLLKTRKARVIKHCPFTIQLLYKSTTYTQNITLRVDAGSKHIGLFATTGQKIHLVYSRQKSIQFVCSKKPVRR